MALSYLALPLLAAESAPLNLGDVYEQGQFKCIDPALKSQMVHDLGIVMNTFSTGNDECDNEGGGKQLLNTLLIIKDGKFDTDFIQTSNGIIKPVYWNYLTERVTRLQQDTACQSWATACVVSGTSVVHIRNTFDKTANPSLTFQMATLVHETRHIDGYAHVICDAGPFKGQYGCDQNFSAGGSYGIEVEYLSRIALHGTNFNPALKTLARLDAIATITSNFNSQPTKSAPVLLLVDRQSGNLDSFDGNSLAEKKNFVIGTDKMIARTNGVNLLPIVRNQMIRFLELDPLRMISKKDSPVWKRINGSTIFDYENSWTEQKKNSLVDINNDTDRQIRLFQDHVETDDQTTVISLNLPVELHPDQLSSVSPCLDTASNASAYIRFSDASFAKIKQIRSADKVTGLSLEKVNCQWPAGVTSLAASNGNIYGLDAAGTLATLDKSGHPSPVAQLAGHKFSQILGARVPPALINQ